MSVLDVQYIDLDTLGGHGKDLKAQLVVVGLSRPHKANALSQEMVSQMYALLESCESDPAIRAVLIYGQGSHFCAGADLQWMQRSAQMNPQDPHHIASSLEKFFYVMSRFCKPVVSYVHGRCVGGALGLVSLSDTVVVQRSAQFSFGESMIGISPWVIYPYVSQVMPAAVLKHMMLTAEVISADKALKYHLCHELISGDPNTRLARVVNSYLTTAPQASNLTKRMCRTQMSYSDYTAGLATQLQTDECQRGLKHFFQKTQPEWSCQLSSDSLFFDLEMRS